MAAVASSDVSTLLKGAPAQGAQMADASTPLIRNCWYVAAWGKEIGRTMLSRRILGQQVALYRTEDGKPIALHDRCPHRSMPLSKGCLEGDEVRCGYHGLKFDALGECTDAPPVPKVPKAMRVRSYPLVERGPLIWIWMGDSALCEVDGVPDCWWLESPDWVAASGFLTMKANYVGLHENLLDLTHFTFLHPGNLGTPEYASAPYTVRVKADTVTITRFVAECDLPSMYVATGLSEKRISRRTISEFLTPAIHAAHVDLTDLSPREGERAVFSARITHFVTPADQNDTHYFFTAARNYATQSEAASEDMQSAVFKAFLEDIDALEAITRLQAFEPDFNEMSIKSDHAGVSMRRILQKLATAEQKTAAGH